MDYSLPEVKPNIETLQKIMQSKTLLYCVVLLFVLRVISIGISINFPQNIFFADITRSALQTFVNQTRQSSGLKPLAENAKLTEAARLKAENMVQNQYFAHTSPSGISPWYWFSKAGYNYKYAGENLAIGFFESMEVYQAWLDSPSHKANIINPNYTEIGTAVLTGFGANNTFVVVQEFGRPVIAYPAPVKPVPVKTTPKNIVPQPKKNPPVPVNPPVSVNPPVPAERVLSQETELIPANNASDKLSSKVANLVLYDYDKILQSVIYGISLLITGILLTLIFFNDSIKFKRKLVFRSFLVITLLSITALSNAEAIASLL